MATVGWLHVAPVKGLALAAREEIELERFGVVENRRFHLVDERGRLVNGKTLGLLVRVAAAWDAQADRLALTLPGGDVLEGAVDSGEPLTTDFFGRPVPGRLVVGPWAGALSELAGKELRLVRADDPGAGVDRRNGAVTLLSTASLAALGRRAGGERVDGRRFRMLIGVEGCREHEEDEWLGCAVRVGGAVVRPLGHVGRCAVTTRNPETGVPDLDTLHILRTYRLDGTEPLPFGVHGEVVSPGRVRLGDTVAPVS